MEITAASLSPEEGYKLMTGAIVPRAIAWVAGSAPRGDVHPYQPEKTQSGLWDVMYHLQNYIAEITGMDAVSLQQRDGQIIVETRLDPFMNLARVEVADNGCGVSPEDKPLLFEPYFSTKASGTGLGLAIVNTIISDHDGYIRVKDNVPQGTRFIIELPIKR